MSAPETVEVPPDAWRAQARRLRDGGAHYLDMVTAAERPGGGFDVIAHLVRLPAAGSALSRTLLATTLPAEGPTIESLTPVYPGAAWHERELAEMFGIDVLGVDATLLLPEPTAPLRKSTPLRARMQTPWPGHEEGSRRRPLGVPAEQP